MKVPELEAHIAHAASALKDTLNEAGFALPDNFQPRVSLLKPDSKGNLRRVRSDASADNWSPESGCIEIRFEPVHSKTPARTNLGSGEGGPRLLAGKGELDNRETGLIRALDRAEARPGWNFVPLRKFRDELLPQEPFASTLTDTERRDLLDRAINDKKLILTGKVTNPKAPQFPVTTIRLNRLTPEVAAVLGQGKCATVDFRPVKIIGEPLSATVLRERR